jgi:hypothetical protein
MLNNARINGESLLQPGSPIGLQRPFAFHLFKLFCKLRFRDPSSRAFYRSSFQEQQIIMVNSRAPVGCFSNSLEDL